MVARGEGSPQNGATAGGGRIDHDSIRPGDNAIEDGTMGVGRYGRGGTLKPVTGMGCGP